MGRSLLAFHLGSNHGVDAICGISLLLALVPAPRVFRRGRFFGFLPSTKTNIFKFKFDLETPDEEAFCGYASPNSSVFNYLFILFYVLLVRIGGLGLLLLGAGRT